jgi:hypothetical protein
MCQVFNSQLGGFNFRYNISFIDPPLGGFGEILPSPPWNVTAQDEETSSDEEFSDVVTVSLPRETRSAQSRKPATNGRGSSQYSDNLAVDDNLETPELQPPTETEETLDLSGEQNNLNPVDEIPTIPVVENLTPQRVRYPPDRLTYYNSGDTEPFGVFPISATVPPNVWQPLQ